MNDDWGFTQEDAQEPMSKKALKKSYETYTAPISKHKCAGRGCGTKYGRDSNLHEIEEVWDDFELSQKQREEIHMEVIRSRGRVNREATLLRQFVSTIDGSYLIRISTATQLQATRMGEIRFQTRDECAEYYNYCVNLFGFSKDLLVPDEEDGSDFFADLDELSGEFFDDLDDIEDEDEWDMDDDDDDTGWI
jgi:hypothetical protein